jgi:hypothetical protein
MHQRENPDGPGRFVTNYRSRRWPSPADVARRPGSPCRQPCVTADWSRLRLKGGGTGETPASRSSPAGPSPSPRRLALPPHRARLLSPHRLRPPQRRPRHERPRAASPRRRHRMYSIKNNQKSTTTGPQEPTEGTAETVWLRPGRARRGPAHAGRSRREWGRGNARDERRLSRPGVRAASAMDGDEGVGSPRAVDRRERRRGRSTTHAIA